MNDFEIVATPNCPRCGVPLSLFDNELPCGTIWYCDNHMPETGLESVFLTLRDIDRVLRDPAAWDVIVADHQRIEARS